MDKKIIVNITVLISTSNSLNILHCGDLPQSPKMQSPTKVRFADQFMPVTTSFFM